MNQCQVQIVENLVLKVSEKLNVPVSEIKGRKQKEEYCIARAMVWVVCKNDLSLSFHKIGKLFDRNHKSVRESYLNMRDEIEVNKERRVIYKELVNG